MPEQIMTITSDDDGYVYTVATPQSWYVAPPAIDVDLSPDQVTDWPSPLQAGELLGAAVKEMWVCQWEAASGEKVDRPQPGADDDPCFICQGCGEAFDDAKIAMAHNDQCPEERAPDFYITTRVEAF